MVTGAHSQSAGEGVHQRPDRSNTKVYLVGGGIASLAAAAFIIRDAHISGHNITIL
jgi:myosin-crossreactive antigen